MKIFIWHDLDQVSDNYHSNGGLLVVAKSIERARELANAQKDIQVKDDDIPDITYELNNNYDEEVMVFPNAGCC